MDDSLRRDIAFIAGVLISGVKASSIYDYRNGNYVNISGEVHLERISVYDYFRRCFIAGSVGSLYDYGNGKHISLKLSGTSFNGYDYGSGFHFSGSVAGNSISFYDYETSQYYNFSL
mgnify:CR=1 FL=1